MRSTGLRAMQRREVPEWALPRWSSVWPHGLRDLRQRGEVPDGALPRWSPMGPYGLQNQQRGRGRRKGGGGPLKQGCRRRLWGSK